MALRLIKNRGNSILQTYKYAMNIQWIREEIPHRIIPGYYVCGFVPLFSGEALWLLKLGITWSWEGCLSVSHLGLDWMCSSF
jgi:hypothetical protein